MLQNINLVPRRYSKLCQCYKVIDVLCFNLTEVLKVFFAAESFQTHVLTCYYFYLQVDACSKACPPKRFKHNFVEDIITLICPVGES